MERNLAKISQAKMDKVSVDLATAGVAFEERHGTPVVANLIEREQPAHLRDWFCERLITHRLASVSLSQLPWEPKQKQCTPACSPSVGKTTQFLYACCFALERAMLRVIDTGTRGLQGGIIGIASISIVDGRTTNPMSHLVRPDRPITPQTMAIHRTMEEMVADKPWIEETIPHYLDSPQYVAHNANFNRRVLSKMSGEWICTMKLARRLWPGTKYSDMGLYKSRKLNVAVPPGLHHHRALYDCYTIAALLLDIINVSDWAPDEMADITGRPALFTTFTLGKYRGKMVAEITENDPGYLRWLFSNFDRISLELRLTLKHYLRE